MSTPAQPPPWYQTDKVQLASGYVHVDSLGDNLPSFLQTIGAAHRTLFGHALIITSGNDGNHVAASAHYKNKAVDVRSQDLSNEQQAIFSLVLGYFSRAFGVAVFDERFTTSPHWHIQTADSVGG